MSEVQFLALLDRMVEHMSLDGRERAAAEVLRHWAAFPPETLRLAEQFLVSGEAVRDLLPL